MDEFSHPTLDALATLLAKFENPAYPGDVEQIKAYKRDIEDAVSRETVAEDPALQAIMRGYLKEVEDMETDLRTLDSRALPDNARDRMLDKITLYKDFCKRFDIKEIRSVIDSVDKWTRENLEAVS